MGARFESVAAGAVEVRRSFRMMVADLRTGRRFWVPVACGILPAVIAAMAVSSNYPRLVVELTLDDMTYVTREHPQVDRKVFSKVLNHMLHDEISSQVEQLLPIPAKEESKGLKADALPALSEENKGVAGTPAPTATMSKGPAEPSATPVIANQGETGASQKSDEKAPGFFVKITCKIRVTNIGTLSSTIRGLGMVIVEDAEGQRDVWEQHVENDLDIKLPQGQTAEIELQAQKTVLFWRISKVFMEYESVKLLGERLRALHPKERNLYPYAIPFLELLGGKDYDRERLLRIANPKLRSRLMLVVEVRDVYGRQGRAEVDLLNSKNWMVQDSGSMQSDGK